MNIYECGTSVAQKLAGREVKYNTYVCVIPVAKDYTLKQAVEQMKLNLQKQNIRFKHKAGNPLTVVEAKTKNEYTLAHSVELITPKGKKEKTIIRKPSSIYKHIMTQPLNWDMAYYDKIGDLIVADKMVTKYLTANYLDLSKNFGGNIFHYDDNLLHKVFRYVLEYNLTIGDQLNDKLYYMQPDKVACNKEKILEVANDHVTAFMEKFACNSYPAIRTLFFTNMAVKMKFEL